MEFHNKHKYTIKLNFRRKQDIKLPVYWYEWYRNMKDICLSVNNWENSGNCFVMAFMNIDIRNAISNGSSRAKDTRVDDGGLQHLASIWADRKDLCTTFTHQIFSSQKDVARTFCKRLKSARNISYEQHLNMWTHKGPSTRETVEHFNNISDICYSAYEFTSANFNKR